MKDFTLNQMILHKEAEKILTRKLAKETWAKLMGEQLAQFPSSFMADFYQEEGDKAAGEAMKLQVEYFEKLRQINEPILFKETREANVKQPSEANAKMVRDLLHVVDAAEEHSKHN